MKPELFIFTLFVSVMNLNGQDLPLNRKKHTFSLNYGQSREKMEGELTQYIYVISAYEPSYNYPKYEYIGGYGGGYWYSNANLQNSDAYKYGKEIKLLYAFNKREFIFTAGLNFSQWSLQFTGDISSEKSYFKMPEVFKQQRNIITHHFEYSDKTTYLQIPIGIGADLMNPQGNIHLIPIFKINPEFQIGKKVFKNEVIHHYYFHSKEFEWAGNTYPAYHQDDIIVEHNADYPMKFNSQIAAGLYLNPSLGLIFGLDLYRGFGLQIEFGGKIKRNSRASYDTVYQSNKSLYAHFGISYSL